MNDIAKNSTGTRLIKAMEREKMGAAETGRILGILPQYVSMMKKQEYYSKCPASAWEAALKWANSGQTLQEYSQKHGAVLKPERAETIVITNLPENSKTMSLVNADNIAAKEAESPQKDPVVKQLEDFEPRPGMMGKPQESEPQKVKIDIEINLIINGKKIVLA